MHTTTDAGSLSLDAVDVVAAPAAAGGDDAAVALGAGGVVQAAEISDVTRQAARFMSMEDEWGRRSCTSTRSEAGARAQRVGRRLGVPS
jgi:hypothetical protein